MYINNNSNKLFNNPLNTSNNNLLNSSNNPLNNSNNSRYLNNSFNSKCPNKEFQEYLFKDKLEQPHYLSYRHHRPCLNKGLLKWELNKLRHLLYLIFQGYLLNKLELLLYPTF